jgi:hypothetical protein
MLTQHRIAAVRLEVGKLANLEAGKSSRSVSASKTTLFLAASRRAYAATASQARLIQWVVATVTRLPRRQRLLTPISLARPVERLYAALARELLTLP